MRRLASMVLLPTCGVRMTFGSDREIAAALDRHVGLPREHVERRPRDAARGKRFEQRRLVDDRAARGVDQPGSRRHHRQPLAIDEAEGAPASRGMCRLTKSASRTAAAKSFVTVEMLIARRCRRIRPGHADHLHAVAERGNARDARDRSRRIR